MASNNSRARPAQKPKLQLLARPLAASRARTNMGTSYIDFKEHGYWASDSILEALSFMLTREFDKLPNKQEWQLELANDWTDAATGGYSGCVPSYLNEYFTSTDRLKLLRTALLTIIEGIKSDEDFITTSELNSNNVGLGGWTQINRRIFRNAAELMLRLIDGKLKTNESSPIDYWDEQE